jgi:O-antigen/teichoic acid export membrane protein
VFYSLGFQLLSHALAYLGSFLLVALWSFFLILKVFPLLKVKSSPDKKTFKDIITFSIPVTIASIISSILASEDTAILTYFRSLSEVGLYSVAIPTVSLIRYVPKALSIIMFPLSAELYFKAKDKLASTLTQMYKYLFIIVVPISLIFFSFSEEVINILFGEKFIGAAIAFKILSVAMIFASIYTVNHNIILGIGKPKTYTKIIFIEAILNTVFDLILIPFFGIAGAGFATCVSSFLMLIVSSINIKKYIKNNIPWKNWIKVFLCGYGVVLVIFFLKDHLNLNTWLEIGIILPIAGIVYLALILLTKTILPREILSLFKGIKG